MLGRMKPGGRQLVVTRSVLVGRRQLVVTRSVLVGRRQLVVTRSVLVGRRQLVVARTLRLALALVAAVAPALIGCSTLLELEPPALSPDAGIDAPDARPDAAATTRECPAAPTGCALFECGVSTSCYYVCEAAVRWELAQSYCTEVGGLATIDAQAEQDCVTAAAHPTNAAPVWIGYHQPTGSGEPSDGWAWAVGTSPYTNWASFEPNDLSGDQDCASMTNNGQWADTLCSYSRRFVCELP
jgi:hypothetical protein